MAVASAEGPESIAPARGQIGQEGQESAQQRRDARRASGIDPSNHDLPSYETRIQSKFKTF